MNITIIGAGYVGLVSGACLADRGHRVICVDLDERKVDSINRGVAPIHEAGLPELLQKYAGNLLTATTDLASAISHSDISIIAVGTPFNGARIDLSQIEDAAARVGSALARADSYHVVLVKSTVVPGTTDEVVRPILEEKSGKRAGRDFGLGMNPEFLREGVAVNDFSDPDRLVFGAIDERTLEVLERLYHGYEGVPRLRTNIRTAEMIKYASNAFWATLISFSNEIGNLCALHTDVDALDVLGGVHLDRRFGTRDAVLAGLPPIVDYIAAGCGFGGSCFPKDLRALIAHGRNLGSGMQLLQAVVDINAQQPASIIAALRRHFTTVAGVRIAVLGLAFKPGTSDIRESPAIAVVNELLQLGAALRVYDPAAMAELSPTMRSRVAGASSLVDCIDGADAIVIMTAWPEFRQLPELLSRTGASPLVVDGRRLLHKRSVARYEGIGVRHGATSVEPVPLAPQSVVR
jgi:UDPglucose 6-dehydrogenase/GDP-mannose 6-dehydrogenase